MSNEKNNIIKSNELEEMAYLIKRRQEEFGSLDRLGVYVTERYESKVQCSFGLIKRLHDEMGCNYIITERFDSEFQYEIEVWYKGIIFFSLMTDEQYNDLMTNKYDKYEEGDK